MSYTGTRTASVAWPAWDEVRDALVAYRADPEELDRLTTDTKRALVILVTELQMNAASRASGITPE
jgi:hypothetical protein